MPSENFGALYTIAVDSFDKFTCYILAAFFMFFDIES